MKILTDKYPIGTIKGQKTPGRYIDENYYMNLKSLAEVITNDMTFMAIISSSTFEVGTGKSVFVQQSAEAWLSLVKDLHGINIPDLSMKNIVFKPADLITRAFEVPQYSVVIVDEWEDAHYWSQLGMSLRQFFRKCRQLNLFIFLIIPNFFQMPMTYAISRSIFFIDVRFEGNFERGYFRFFSFKKKKDLYIYGKKTQNYECVKPDFIGRFTSGYVVDERAYRDAKRKDMLDSEEEHRPLDQKQIKAMLVTQLKEKLPQITNKTFAEACGVSERTIDRWLHEIRNSAKILEIPAPEKASTYYYNINEPQVDNDEVEAVP